MSIPLHNYASAPQTDDSLPHHHHNTPGTTTTSSIEEEKEGQWVRISYREVAHRILQIPYRDLAYRQITNRELLWRVAYLIGGAIALVFFGFLTYGSITGWTAYRDLTKPHRKIHATTADAKDGESRVVRPYFAPPGSKGAAGMGVVEQVEMGVTVWFREGVDPEPPEWHRGHGDDTGEWRWWNTRGSGGPVNGEYGYVLPEEKQNDWEEVWSGKVLRGGVAEDLEERVKVTLPGRMIQSLSTNPFSRLVATFTLLPHPSTLSSTTTFRHSSTRPIDQYGHKKPWPSGWTSSFTTPPTTSTPIDDFLALSSAGYDLRVQRYTPADNLLRSLDQHSIYLKTRTWVTMAKDFPTYKLDSFHNAMEELKKHKQSCIERAQIWHMDECLRSFANDGHFENLLEEKPTKGSGGGSKWRYGPFITTRMSSERPQDFVKLPKYSELVNASVADVDDVILDWHLSYSAISPAKLFLANQISGTYSTEHFNPSMTDAFQARSSDYLELFNALIGHSFNPKAHPIARRGVGVLAIVLQYLTIPFILHYWATRQISAGISIGVLTFQSFSDLIYHIVQSAINFDDVVVFFFVMKIIGFVVLILKQLQLWSRVEFKLNEWWMPSAVRFRPATKEEKESKQSDGRFDWKLKLLIFIVAFVLLRFGPSPPSIVYAPRYEDELRRYKWEDPNEVKIFVHRTMDALQSSMWLLSRLSQIHLNSVRKTFGSQYGITAYLLFTSLLLSHATTIGVRWFGRAEFMQPFEFWDLLTLVAEGILVAQARMYKRVDQKDYEGLGI